MILNCVALIVGLYNIVVFAINEGSGWLNVIQGVCGVLLVTLALIGFLS